ncbi:MAG: calcium-binding protein, partial [Gaiellaceae bacterium]
GDVYDMSAWQLDPNNRYDLGGHDINPNGNEERYVELFDQSFTPVPGTFGDDNIAGGTQDDIVFGQLGNDTIQGDGSTIDDTGATTIDVLHTHESVEDYLGIGADGRDWIEGNGGNDTIFGGFGQDNLIGGSSNLYSLKSASQRPDGSDEIFGGAGVRLERNNYGDLSGPGHAHDADTILGDNGDIFELTGINGHASSPYGFLTFNYDTYSSTERLIPRAYRFLDYTPGAPDAAGPFGTADLIHGENGDDTIHGMHGDDVLFGEGEDDNVYGGTGNDRIYGGTGSDGILGDDGVMLTSRNGLTEPLNRLFTPNLAYTVIEPGPFTSADLFIPGELFKMAQLVMPITDPMGLDTPLSGGNDVIYGGLGDDFIHGGSGDDAISGAEALREFYNELPVVETNPLDYDGDPNSATFTKFAAYNAVDPWSIIPGWFLNFDSYVVDEATGQQLDSNGELIKSDDGRDRLYGDLGNDWIVGGTNCDWLFGGFGDDYLQLDDNLLTDGGKNDNPEDADPRFRDGDFAFGGAGRDVLIANTALDRMYDWGGEFNTYVVPFSPFGNPTVNREFSPWAQDLIRALSLGGGEDIRFVPFSPYDELALVTPKDHDLWLANHGGPRDPQPGNIGGVHRDDTGTGNLSCACDFAPAVHIAKLLSTVDGTVQERSAEAGTIGIVVPTGKAIFWTYRVTNVSQNPTQTVNAALVVTSLIDDNGTPANAADDFRPRFVGGDTNGNGLLDVGEVWIFTSQGVAGAMSTAPAGTVANTATVQARCVTTGVPGCVSGTTVADTAVNRVTGSGDQLIRIKKAINAVDPLHPTPAEEADSPTGPVLAVGSAITWTYRVTTTSSTPLTITLITDDNGTPNNAADDLTPVYMSGDANLNGKLDPGEVWLYRAIGTAVLGRYTNIGAVKAVTTTNTTVASSDTASYLGTTGIRIKKAVNAVDPGHPTLAEDANVAPGPTYPNGTALIYTYLVYGDSALPLTNVVVRDDNATPTNPADDFTPIYVSGDVNGNGKLDYGEIWLFTSTGATPTPLKLRVGLFTNTATVTATNGQPVSASDVANVTGKQESIQIVKAVNAFDPAHPDYFEDANAAPGQYLTNGTLVTVTFAVSIADGFVPVANVVVTDAPAMAIAPVLQTNGKNIGDTNSNGLLDFGEIWIFKAT